VRKPATVKAEDRSKRLRYSIRGQPLDDAPGLAPGRMQEAKTAPTRALTLESSPLPQADVQLGASRLRVRELLGEPDLAVSKLEKDNVVEQFVYVDQLQNMATTIFLVDGRVVSVYSGVPSVSWKGSAHR